MRFQTLKLVVVGVALACAQPAMGQGCGCGSTGHAGGQYAFNDCGRAITQQQAEGLWADYCTESCGFAGGDCGHGCRLGGRLRGRGGLQAGGCCACANGSGCFGYPTGGMAGGGFAGGRFANRGCGGGCNLGGKLKGLFAGRGCGNTCDAGCDSGCDSCAPAPAMQYDDCGCGGADRGCGCKLGGKLKGLFAGGLFRNGCGCGTKGRLFHRSPGYDFDCPTMQSCVAGCATSAVAPSIISMPSNSQSVIENQHYYPAQPAIESPAVEVENAVETGQLEVEGSN